MHGCRCGSQMESWSQAHQNGRTYTGILAPCFERKLAAPTSTPHRPVGSPQRRCCYDVNEDLTLCKNRKRKAKPKIMNGMGLIINAYLRIVATTNLVLITFLLHPHILFLFSSIMFFSGFHTEAGVWTSFVNGPGRPSLSHLSPHLRDSLYLSSECWSLRSYVCLRAVSTGCVGTQYTLLTSCCGVSNWRARKSGRDRMTRSNDLNSGNGAWPFLSRCHC